MKFKKGDKVLIRDENYNFSDILSDNLLELEDGNGVNQRKLGDALHNHKPFTVDEVDPEGYGYVLKLEDEQLYGIHEEETLISYEEATERARVEKFMGPFDADRWMEAWRKAQ